ncbi:MAG: Rieske 2Fe-2S domain-containing protein [Eggerthellaceae bacterium]
MLNVAVLQFGYLDGEPGEAGKRCSHMGCSLERNGVEDSWDCPCHGSRFDADGNVLDRPATKPISV